MTASSPSVIRSAVFVFLSLIAAVLPAGDRRRLSRRYSLGLNGASLFVGATQVMVGGAVWAYGFLIYGGRISNLQTAAAGMNVEPSESLPTLMFAGPLTFIAYLLTPVGLLLAYITLTGVMRLVVLGTVREPLGDPLLVLVLWGGRSFRRGSVRQAQLARLGPERPDRIKEEGALDLVVLSCREKPEWNKRVTIQIGSRFYRLRGVGERQDGAQRAITYHLREADPGEVVRGLVRYDGPTAAKFDAEEIS